MRNLLKRYQRYEALFICNKTENNKLTIFYYYSNVDYIQFPGKHLFGNFLTETIMNRAAFLTLFLNVSRCYAVIGSDVLVHETYSTPIYRL